MQQWVPWCVQVITPTNKRTMQVWHADAA